MSPGLDLYRAYPTQLLTTVGEELHNLPVDHKQIEVLDCCLFGG